MSIVIYLGNVGSGKTASAVRDLVLNTSQRTTYSNIITKNVKNNITINPNMIIKKEMIGAKKNGEPIYELSLNQEFWQNIKDPINVVLDEAHSIMNPRRAMSKVNIIVTDWIALIRRVLGNSDSGMGQLILITQLDRRLDPIAREMATLVKFHRCHYMKTCSKCKYTWTESNDIPEPRWNCPKCKSQFVKKHNHRIEVLHFADMEKYQQWKDFGSRTFHKHYLVNDIEKYFKYYNTLQWDNMFSNLY